METTLAPAESSLPDVLPTDRLFASGKAKTGVAPGLRDIRGARNAFSVVAVWAQIAAGWLLVRAFDHPVVWVGVALWIARCFSLIFLLNHESAHALLFNDRTKNDWVGRLFLAWPALLDYDGYRRAHLAHHKDELGPDEPDMGLYAGYPSERRRLGRRLLRDATGRSAYKQLRLLKSANRSTVIGIVGAQLPVALAAFAVTGNWWAWLAFWVLPWATVWQVINRLRAIAEHAGMAPGPDRRRNTHVVRQRWLPSNSLVPFNAGYHLAHHVDTSVPWNNLPTLHTELESAGWITPDFTHRSYRALWRYLTTTTATATTSS